MGKTIRHMPLDARPILVTAVLLVAALLASFALTAYVYNYEESQSVDRLSREAERLGQELDMTLIDDTEQMAALAMLASHHSDITSSEFLNVLGSYSTVGAVSRLELLLPDNTVLLRDGVQIDASGVLSFEEEASQGTHMSRQSHDLTNPDRLVVRIFTPIVQDGQTVALLCGVIELDTLMDSVTTSPYEGQAGIMLIEGETGDLLVDTCSRTRGDNLWKMPAITLSSEYNQDEVKQSLASGEAGYVEFSGTKTGRTLYLYHQPTSVRDWQVAVVVTEDVVFTRATDVRLALLVFLTFVIVCFGGYFTWILSYVRRETTRKQQQLDNVNHVHEVEELLFNAHENKGNIQQALERLARMTDAERAGLCLMENGTAGRCFIWDNSHARPINEEGGSNATEAELRAVVAAYKQLLQGKSSLAATTEDELQESFGTGANAGIWNLFAIPIKDDHGDIRGVLGVGNAKAANDVSPLRSVEFCFGMFCRNLHTFEIIKEQGERDLLTRLNNRNRFETDREHHAEWCQHSLTCVYLDVNGLHELNNREGHEAGDRLLQTVAELVRSKFGDRFSYRIGGDEFVALLPDTSREKAALLVREVRALLTEAGASVSIGVGYSTDVLSIEGVIRSAEQAMFEEKRLYYQQEGRGTWSTERFEPRNDIDPDAADAPDSTS